MLKYRLVSLVCARQTLSGNGFLTDEFIYFENVILLISWRWDERSKNDFNFIVSLFVYFSFSKCVRKVDCRRGSKGGSRLLYCPKKKGPELHMQTNCGII